MSDLERRYRRLLRAYPADYRRERGDEIVGTYLDLAGPGRRRPSPADAADLVRGGLRQRLRAAGATDLAPGVRLAAVLALATAGLLAAFWLVAEQRPAPVEWGVPRFGPFVSLGIGGWLAWLAPALLAAVAPARITRYAVAFAVLCTVAVVPVSAVAGVPRPPLFVLLPQVALGLVALAWPARLPRAARAVPLTAGAVGGAGALVALGGTPYWGYYGWTGAQILPVVGATLLAVVVLLAVGLSWRHDRRGVWAGAVLVTPVGLLTLKPVAAALDGPNNGLVPSWPLLAVTALAVTLLGPAAVAFGLTRHQRRTRPTCPTCGHPHRAEHTTG